MRRYETILVFGSMVTEEQVNTEIERYKKFLEENGATSITVNNWGKREMAFEMNKASHGNYVVFYFEAKEAGVGSAIQGGIVGASNRHLRIVETLVKFQTHRIPDAVRKFKGRLGVGGEFDSDDSPRDRYDYDAM